MARESKVQALQLAQKYPGPIRLNMKTTFPGIIIAIIDIRLSWTVLYT